MVIPVCTGCKMSVHKTFRGRPRRLLSVLRTFNLRLVSSGIWLQLSYFNIHFLYVLQCPENSFRLCDVNSPWNIKAYSFVLSLNFALVLNHKSFSYQIVMPLTILWRLIVMPKKCYEIRSVFSTQSNIWGRVLCKNS